MRAKAVRISTGQVVFFDTYEAAYSFCLKRADQNELWKAVKLHEDGRPE